jgi:hypothetical protein
MLSIIGRFMKLILKEVEINEDNFLALGAELLWVIGWVTP